jgi:hypothetical protein
MDDRGPQRGLLNLLCAQNCTTSHLSLLAADIGYKEALELLHLFVTHFHIYNPVLDVLKIEEQIKRTAMNGLEWDAQSCLLVS